MFRSLIVLSIGCWVANSLGTEELPVETCNESEPQNRTRVKRQWHGLPYKTTDPIMILDFRNFDSAVLNSDAATYVEFYYDWCPHCQRLAPHFRQFAKSVQTWNEIAVVAAINCAKEWNKQTCYSAGISSAPQIRYYPRFTRDVRSVPKHYAYNSMESLRNQLAGMIKKEYKETRPQTWPNFDGIDYRVDTAEALFNTFSTQHPSHGVLLADGGHDDNTMGVQAVLDLWPQRWWVGTRLATGPTLLASSKAPRMRPAFLLMFRRGQEDPIMMRDIRGWSIPTELIDEVKAWKKRDARRRRKN